MKVASSVAVLLATLAFTGPANAGAYAGLGVQSLFIDLSTIEYRAQTMSARLSLGFEITKYFGFEGHVGAGLTDDSVEFRGSGPGFEADLEAERFHAIYAKGILPLGEQTKLYALVGWADTELSASAGDDTASDNDSDLSYGVGFDLLTEIKKLHAFVDAIMLYNDDEAKIFSVGAGLRWDFAM